MEKYKKHNGDVVPKLFLNPYHDNGVSYLWC